MSKVTEIFDGKTQVIIGDEFSNRRETMVLHHTEAIDQVGNFAMQLIHHFGVVSATIGPEDSSGRATMVLLPEDDLVARAFKIAEATYSRLYSGGHIASVPKIHQSPSKDE